MTLPLMEILNMLPVSECAVLSRHRAFSCASAGNRLGGDGQLSRSRTIEYVHTLWTRCHRKHRSTRTEWRSWDVLYVSCESRRLNIVFMVKQAKAASSQAPYASRRSIIILGQLIRNRANSVLRKKE